ncbi:hypothetical protein Kpho01_76180 [Kitasatospora phosalacinea]|uniref:Uncharacterized protein n=1 Tax=Kitasatospora phosalacinea TaxID=2065 RepID=A0A9W6UTF8_9ACTN|nr:hypothetical protein Kpho01_76180 [Kitasatospora phosalacinea]
MRGRPWLVRITVIVSGLCGAAVLLLAIPDKALAWAVAGGAAAAAALGQRAPELIGEAIKGRSRTHELETADPFTTDVRLRNIDYVTFTDGSQTEDVPASGHTVQLIVTGALPEAVLLTDLRVEVIAWSPRFGALSRHAAEVPRRRFEALLDARPPQVKALDSSDFPYAIASQESEAFDIKITTEAGDVQWVLWLDWQSGKRSGSARVDLGGHPFRTAARDSRQAG